MCSGTKKKLKKNSERDKRRERHPTRSNEQSRNSAFPTVSFLGSSKPKNTYIRVSLALRISPDPCSLPHICLSLYRSLFDGSSFDHLSCLLKANTAGMDGTLLSVWFRKGFQSQLESNAIAVGLFLFPPSLSSGFSSSSSAEAMATLSLWDASRSRKRLVAWKIGDENT